MAKLLGPLVGAAIDRRDGDSGTKGALLGYVVQSLPRAIAGLAVTAAIGLGVKRLLDRSAAKKPATAGRRSR